MFKLKAIYIYMKMKFKEIFLLISFNSHLSVTFTIIKIRNFVYYYISFVNIILLVF
jgi:hypothetical protein